ncbi:amino acid adenylation domain-containing protein [Spongiibacter sp. KMU-158]|uniref:Amino acid adenylation domain-containing protein n=1 Tax=Spongiibacter pelagi TaxID=2760804 RepID=A0A927GUX3_9GAMM|nr:non-ribosomal peptide synthetase [Spongiibacter pelagi]MBD2857478.1 amino acid adenylation domain-containing protein [Spongiibacter pelagi]
MDAKQTGPAAMRRAMAKVSLFLNPERNAGHFSMPGFSGAESESGQSTLPIELVKKIPLAQSQRGMWMGEKLAPVGTLFNLAEYCEILGEVDVAVFMRSLHTLTQEAETCRVQVVDEGENACQHILSRYPGELPFVDFSGESNPHKAAADWMRADYTRTLNIATEALWLGALIKLSERHYYFYQRCHHINLDGFSGGVLTRRLGEIYNAYLHQEPLSEAYFHDLEHQQREEQSYRESKRFERDRDYWVQTLAKLPEPLSLSKGGERCGGLMRSSLALSLESSNALRGLAETTGSTLPQVMIALLASYIYRISGAEDLVFGMPVTARVNRQQRNTPCMMANAVAIRLAMSGELALADLLKQVGETVRKSLRHQQYRYEALRKDLNLLGKGQQISWVGVNIEPFDYDLRFGEAGTRSHNLSNGSVEDLTVFVYDRGAQQPLRVDLDANPGLYTQAQLDTHLQRLERLINSFIARPQTTLAELDILNNGERQRLLKDWNNTEQALPETSVIELFEQQALSAPEALAVSDGQCYLSYGELHQRACRLASVLYQQGVRSGDVVAVAMPRNVDMLVSLLAVQRSGAAYLPLDPDAPVQRLAAICEEARPALMICGEAGLAIPVDDNTRVYQFAALAEMASDAPLSDIIFAPIRAESPVYVIYTSGSTGRPKGVVISQRNLLNFMLAMQQTLQPSADNRFLALTTVAFDIATLELYLPLICGAATVIADRATVKDPRSLNAFIAEHQVDIVQATPSHWQLMLAEGDEGLQGVQALVGGEALPPALAKKLCDLGPAPINLYGPTETTVWSTAMCIDEREMAAPPIGRPIWNTQLYVLDAHLSPVPCGEIGELYIGGEGVAQGYLHRPELTAERFMPNPFAEGRIYRTGDLVRWREDGALEYLGRNDFQIKIRGFRVEVGEIEALIDQLDGVSSSAVIACTDPAGATQLVAYVKPDSFTQDNIFSEADAQRIIRELKLVLPEYMVPVKVLALAEFPTNVNGKLDRKALPLPQWCSQQAYVAPTTELETLLVSLWQDVLERDRIGIHESFFDLGGDSIKAALLVSKLRNALEQEVPLLALFEANTIAELAANLEKSLGAEPFDNMLALRRGDAGQSPLFCIHPVLGLSWGFAGLAGHLADGRPLYALQAAGLKGDAELPGSIEEMAADYLAQIREQQPQGPYQLLGWSMGGVVAHELARQLEELGEKVAFLGMMDAYPHQLAWQNEAALSPQTVRSTLAFLGLNVSEAQALPEDMSGLSDYLCREYRIHDLPIVDEMQSALPAGVSIIDTVSRVIENNLRLLGGFVPGVVDADLLFFRAAASSEVDMADVLHHSPAVWCRHARAVELVDVDCAHQQMLEPDALAQIGPVVNAALQRADRMLWFEKVEKVLTCA